MWMLRLWPLALVLIGLYTLWLLAERWLEVP